MDIVLTPYPGMNPVPAVAVAVTLTAADIGDAASITVERVTAEGASAVRGGYRLTPTTSTSIMDAEAPFNTEVAYRVVFLTDDGTVISYTEPSGTVVLPHEGTVVQRVMEPSVNAEIIHMKGSAQSHQHSFGGSMYGTPGLPTWVGSPSRSFSTRVVARVYDEAHRDRLVGLFGRPGDQVLPVFCLRTTEPLRLPQPFFCVIDSPQTAGVDWWKSGDITEVVWDMTATRPPGLGLSVPVLTWADVAATYDTWADAAARYGTWADLMQDYSIAGAGS